MEIRTALQCGETMHLIERLEKRTRELDQMTRAGDYNQQAADDRDLLLLARDVLRAERAKYKDPERELPWA